MNSRLVYIIHAFVLRFPNVTKTTNDLSHSHRRIVNNNVHAYVALLVYMPMHLICVIYPKNSLCRNTRSTHSIASSLSCCEARRREKATTTPKINIGRCSYLNCFCVFHIVVAVVHGLWHHRQHKLFGSSDLWAEIIRVDCLMVAIFTYINCFVVRTKWRLDKTKKKKYIKSFPEPVEDDRRPAFRKQVALPWVWRCVQCGVQRRGFTEIHIAAITQIPTQCHQIWPFGDCNRNRHAE